MKAIHHNRQRRGFTLVELMVVIAIVAILSTLALSGYQSAIRSSQAAASSSNLRQLAAANIAYATDHGTFCPAQERRNLIRWHGARTSGNGEFDGSQGFLSPYLGRSRQVKVCPLLREVISGSESWEWSTGGYGYNAAYIGGTPGNFLTPERPSNVSEPAQTVMFTTTAIAVGDGLQEYPYAEPYFHFGGRGGKTAAEATVHFRANGRALVAWCDGHVSAELPDKLDSGNIYGGDAAGHQIGWFGPEEDNGFWNPQPRRDP